MQRFLTLGLATCFVLLGCADDSGGEEEQSTSTESGDGDGDPGDGDGDPGDGDGDAGDGDGDAGDGDGDAGDGDGDAGDGDGDPGDGDGDPGDGDGDPGDGDGDPGDGDGDPDGLCDEQYGSCDALSAAFAAETQAIRSCSTDAECGQVLQGTSCGCTRNWVARTEADTTCFYALIEQAGPLQCELGLGSPCDCPEADGYACVDGICTWNYL